MTDPTAAPVRYYLRGSRALAGWLVIAYGGAVATLWGSALPAEAAAAFSALAAAGFVRGLRLHALRAGRDAAVWLEVGAEPRIGLAGGREYAARFRGSPFVHPWLVILRLESENGSTSVVVPSDSLSAPAEHKALRRLLRHGGAP